MEGKGTALPSPCASASPTTSHGRPRPLAASDRPRCCCLLAFSVPSQLSEGTNLSTSIPCCSDHLGDLSLFLLCLFPALMRLVVPRVLPHSSRPSETTLRQALRNIVALLRNHSRFQGLVPLVPLRVLKGAGQEIHAEGLAFGPS